MASNANVMRRLDAEKWKRGIYLLLVYVVLPL